MVTKKAKKGRYGERGFKRSFAEAYPDLVQYLVNSKDGENKSSCCKDKVLMKCPDCGYVWDRSLRCLGMNGFLCPMCEDNISRPNKFLRYFLLQLKDQGAVVAMEWKQGRFLYDGYIEFNGEKIVIEMQGAQHYKNNGYFKRDDIENDKMKRALIEKLGYQLVEVECIKTDFDYIYTNFTLNPILKKIIESYEIDWNKIRFGMTENYVKKVCDFYNIHKEEMTRIKMAEALCLNKNVLTQYLIAGSKLGWCNGYDRNSSKNFAYTQNVTWAIPVVVFDLMGVVLESEKSSVAIDIINEKTNAGVTKKGVSRALRDGLWHKGFFFVKKEDLTEVERKKLEEFRKTHDLNVLKEDLAPKCGKIETKEVKITKDGKMIDILPSFRKTIIWVRKKTGTADEDAIRDCLHDKREQYKGYNFKFV